MEEREEWDSSDDEVNISQSAGKKIREWDDDQRRAEESHARMTLKAEFFMWTTDWWLPPTQGGSSIHLIR